MSIGLNEYDYYSKVLKTIIIRSTKQHFLVVISFHARFQNTKKGLAPLVQGTILFSFDLRKSLFGLFCLEFGVDHFGFSISIRGYGILVEPLCSSFSHQGSLVLDLAREGTWCSFPLIVGNTVNLFGKQALSFVALPFQACMLKAYGKIASTKALA